MTIFWVISLCCVNVLSRSVGTLIDRSLFKEKDVNFFHLYFFSNISPLIFGTLVLFSLGELGAMQNYFLTLPCFFLSFVAHLVALSFSYAFRHCKVQQVVLKSKLPELFLPFLALIPIYRDQSIAFSLDWKITIPLLITWIGMIPLLTHQNIRSSFFDKTTLFIGVTLLLQMGCSFASLIPANSFAEIVAYAVAMLMWRCLFILPFYGFQRRGQDRASRSLSKKMIGMICCRAFVAITTQVSLVWCILNGSPLLIWPIMNMSPLISWIMSQAILKEAPHRTEMTAFACFLCGSALPAVL